MGARLIFAGLPGPGCAGRRAAGLRDPRGHERGRGGRRRGAAQRGRCARGAIGLRRVILDDLRQE